MGSAFENVWRHGPAAFVLKAIIVAVVADVLLIAFIVLRRAYRKRLFAKRDARTFYFRQQWDALINGKIPYDSWRQKPLDRRVVETIALDALEAASPADAARLLAFLRTSGLIDKRIFEAREQRGWRRWSALVALGRTRAPEGIPALSEGLRDRHSETRLAALRGLGRMACPEAAEEILAWLSEEGLNVPALPVQSALIQCCAERPQLVVQYLQRVSGPLREVLGRVVGEVAAPSLAMDLLPFTEDKSDELRAASARALLTVQPGMALEALTQLAQDPVWFVRLRAIVSLGGMHDSRAIPLLLKGITDSNRLVRLRAAEGLIEFREQQVSLLAEIVNLHDRYGLHAYITALENANMRHNVREQVESSSTLDGEQKAALLEALDRGMLTARKPETLELAGAGSKI